MYVVAKKVKNIEEYLREEQGENCFTNDISQAIFYEFLGEIPPLINYDEYIVKVELDEDGCIQVADDSRKGHLELEIERLTPMVLEAKKKYEELYFNLDAKKNE
jgi:hypothetical protein